MTATSSGGRNPTNMSPTAAASPPAGIDLWIGYAFGLGHGGHCLKTHRYHELDAMRAIAALGVVCWHYVNAFGASPFGHILAPFYRRGLLLVDFFFILSGFVLARAFWMPERSGYFTANILSRVARLYPLHFATLFVVALLQWYLVAWLHSQPYIYPSNDAYHFVLNLLLLQNSGLQHGASFNAPSWSISSEFLVNVVFLALITLPRRIAGCAMFALASVAVGGLISHGMMQGGNVFGVLDGGLCRALAGFFLGVGLYQAFHKLPTVQHSSAFDAISVGAIALVAVYMASPSWWSNHGDMFCSFVGFPLVIVATIHSKGLRLVLSRPEPVYLGEISYSIYLVHFPMLLMVHVWSTMTGNIVPAESRLYFIGFILAVVVISSMTYRWIENPGRQWISACLPRRSTVVSG